MKVDTNFSLERIRKLENDKKDLESQKHKIEVERNNDGGKNNEL